MPMHPLFRRPQNRHYLGIAKISEALMSGLCMRGFVFWMKNSGWTREGEVWIVAVRGKRRDLGRSLGLGQGEKRLRGFLWTVSFTLTQRRVSQLGRRRSGSSIFELLISRLFKMKVVAAYLLALLGGNASPSAKDIDAILGSVGAEADADRVNLLLSELKGKDILEVIAAGREKFASVPSGGGGGAVVSSGAGGAAPAASEEKKEEEKKEEPKEESDDDMGFSLFD